MSPQSDASVKPWPFDPAAAQNLLAEAGYTKRGNVLVGPDGQEFRFQLMHGTSTDTADTLRFSGTSVSSSTVELSGFAAGATAYSAIAP